MMNTRTLNNNRNITVNRNDLLTTLRTNREAHIKKYKEALDGYLEEAKTKIAEQKENALREVERASKRILNELSMFNPNKAQDTIVFCRGISFELVAPKNYSEAYDQAIEMMTWETKDEVELSTTEFRSFVMDKWDWLEDFEISSARYLKK